MDKNAEIYNLHRDLLQLRREDPVMSRQGADGLDGAVLCRTRVLCCAISRRIIATDRLLVVNLGRRSGTSTQHPSPARSASVEGVGETVVDAKTQRYGGLWHAGCRYGRELADPGECGCRACPSQQSPKRPQTLQEERRHDSDRMK